MRTILNFIPVLDRDLAPILAAATYGGLWLLIILLTLLEG
jgi:hypothetical protein